MDTVDVGERAPDFALSNTAGGETQLSDTLTAGPSVLVFNRGYWCSYCAEQLQTFGALSYDLWRNNDVDVLPIAGDPVPDLVEMRDRFELPLQLLSDGDLEVSRQYTGTEESSKYGEIPIAGTIVVDTEHVVRYAQVAENPADRTYANYVRHFLNNDFTEPYE